MRPERLGRRTIYESDWVNLHVDRVRFPDGRIVEKHHVLEIPFEAVTALVGNESNELLLVRAYRYVVGTLLWETPAGRIEDGESVCAAARREVLEEGGWETVGHEEIYRYYPMNGMADQLFHVVRCRAQEETGEFDRNEIGEVGWFSREEIRGMIARQEIRDGFSLTALLLELAR